ncbi:MAG: hypothetical protein ABSB89_08585 [Candidatus Bathyarchaeia archaeon]
MTMIKAKNGKKIIELPQDIEAFIMKKREKSRVTYQSYFRKLLVFDPTITGEKLIQEKKLWEEEKIETFFDWLTTPQKGRIPEKYNINVSVSICAAVRGYFSSKRMPLVLTREQKEKLNGRIRSTEDFLFSRNDLIKMWNLADLSEKWILCNKSLMMRIEDFASITYGKLRSLHLDEEAPVYFGTVGTEKKRVEAHPFLDSDVVQVVKQLLELGKDKADSDRVFAKSHETASDILKSLVKKAQIQTGNALVRFHNLRKFGNDALKSVMSGEKADLIVGHKVDATQRAYLDIKNLRELFARAMPDLVLGNGNGEVKKKVEALSTTTEQLIQMLAQKDEEIKALKTQQAEKDAEIEILRKSQNTMSKSISQLFELPTVKREFLELKEKVDIT